MGFGQVFSTIRPPRQSPSIAGSGLGFSFSLWTTGTRTLVLLPPCRVVPRLARRPTSIRPYVAPGIRGWSGIVATARCFCDPGRRGDAAWKLAAIVDELWQFFPAMKCVVDQARRPQLQGETEPACE